jgi:hypothetical protein
MMRRVPCAGHEIELVLRVDPFAEPIAGSLTTPSGACERFSGWIGLSAALERIRADAMRSRDL